MRGSFLLRWIDRCFGIPLLFVLGLFRKKREFPFLPERAKIGVLNTAAIGDTILLSAILADLVRAFPKGQIVFFVGSSNKETALLIPGIEVVVIQVTSPKKAVRTIRKKKFDVWIDCGQWPRINGFYSFCARADWKVGFNTPGQYRHYVYDCAVKHERVHELDNFRKLVWAIGVEVGNEPRLVGGRGRREKGLIALHLHPGGSRAVLKEWKNERWVALIDALVKKGYRVCLTGAKRDSARCEEVKKRCEGKESVENLAGKKTLKETAELLGRVGAVVSVDTGIMHLAAVMGCPTVALHGATRPERWGGVGPRVVSLVPDEVVGLHLGFERESSWMEEITIEQVLEALESFSDKAKRGKTNRTPLWEGRGSPRRRRK